MDLMLAFVTGLTTGGLSCLAVQGGLLASSLAHQLEQDVQNQGAKKGKLRPKAAQPILLFLAAKLVAYTLLGLLLGALGSLLQLTAMMRAVLMIAIGIFMLGNGLRMLNIHPIFRIFAIEPPKRLTRYLRRTSKNGESLATPLFLGALTVLIPCGVTQAMMAVALGTGDALLGAAIMFAFTLGTSPVFFGVAYFATRLGATLEKYFMRIVAVVVIILAVVSIDSGLNLAGSPFSISALFGGNSAATSPDNGLSPSIAGIPGVQAPQPNSQPASGNTYIINVKDFGYEPKVLQLPADTPVKLNLVSKNVRSCSLAIVIPDLKYEKLLPSTGTVTVDVPPQSKGKVMRYACSMGMYTGQIVFQ